MGLEGAQVKNGKKTEKSLTEATKRIRPENLEMPKSHRNSRSETRGWDTLGEEEVPKKQKNEPQRANNLGMAHCGQQPGGEEEGRKKDGTEKERQSLAP